MTLDSWQSFFGWCMVLNVGVMILWVAMFWLAHDFVYTVHSRMFRLSAETFDSIHYTTMAVYKIGIFLLNLMPYLALELMK